jgi:hypothetical protein
MWFHQVLLSRKTLQVGRKLAYFLLRRLSVAVRQGNAACILRAIANEEKMHELAFLVFK